MPQPALPPYLPWDAVLSLVQPEAERQRASSPALVAGKGNLVSPWVGGRGFPGQLVLPLSPLIHEDRKQVLKMSQLCAPSCPP